MRTTLCLLAAAGLLAATGCASAQADAREGSMAVATERSDRGWADMTAVFDTTGLDIDTGLAENYAIASTHDGYRAVTSFEGELLSWSSDDFGLFERIGRRSCCRPHLLVEVDKKMLLAGSRWDGSDDVPVLATSDDGGVTWVDLTDPILDGKWVVSIDVIAGAALMTMRQGDVQTYARSTDLETWSGVELPSGAVGYVTDDNTIFAVSSLDRADEPRPPLLVWQSNDVGATFTARPTLADPPGGALVAVNGRMVQLPDLPPIETLDPANPPDVDEQISVLEPNGGWIDVRFDADFWGRRPGWLIPADGRTADGTLYALLGRVLLPENCPPACAPGGGQVLIRTDDGVHWHEVSNAKMPGLYFRIKQRHDLIVTPDGTIVMWIGGFVAHPETLHVTRLIGTPD